MLVGRRGPLSPALHFDFFRSMIGVFIVNGYYFSQCGR